MAKKTTIKFDQDKVAKRIFKNLAEEQTRRLVAYAEEELQRMVESHEFKNRTGQAENSYVWLVCRNGKKHAHGFAGVAADVGKSYLHEWSPEIRERVYGRKAARAFVREYKPSVMDGWEIVWCAAAPYLGYHEGGYHIGDKFYHFAIMSQRYDHIKQTLEPKCNVKFEINPPQY